MNPAEQALLFAATGVVLVGTLIVFVWQYMRMNRRESYGEGMDENPRPDAGSPPPDVEAALGESFTLPLPAGAATGAEWRLELPAGLRSAGESDASPSALPGDPVDSLPLVIADTAGTYQVTARLIRPWDGSVLRTLTLGVRVR